MMHEKRRDRALRTIRRHAAPGWGTLVVLTTVLLGVGPANESWAQQLEINVDEPRALAAAIWVLEKRHGVVITYEDAAYLHSSDLVDGSDRVPDYAGKDPMLVPRDARLDAGYDPPAGYEAADWKPIVQYLIDLHEKNGNPGMFRVEQRGELLHVIPMAAKDADGKMTSQEALLDTPIDLEVKEASGLDGLAAIKAAVNKQGSDQLLIGLAPLKWFAQAKLELVAKGEPARDVLARLLASTGKKLSWALFYDPFLEAFVLNVDPISSE